MAIATKMAPFVHRCTIQSGDLAGNEYFQEVTRYDVEYDVWCPHCHKSLATTENIILHIYAQLTGED